jgi:hypothetical protein
LQSGLAEHHISDNGLSMADVTPSPRISIHSAIEIVLPCDLVMTDSTVTAAMENMIIAKSTSRSRHMLSRRNNGAMTRHPPINIENHIIDEYIAGCRVRSCDRWAGTKSGARFG